MSSQLPSISLTIPHRTEDAPDPSTGFAFVDDLAEAMRRATAAADGKDIGISGGASVIRQCLGAGYVDELAISTAPVVLGAGKRLFEGFDRDLDLEIRSVRHSPYAVHAVYAVRR